MKNFHFSLRNVLSYKQQVLENAQTELAMVNKKLDQVIQEENQKKLDYENKKQMFNEAQQKGVTPQMMLYHNNYLNVLCEEQKVLEKKHKALQKEHTAVMERLTAIKIETSALEKLQHKEFQQYRADVVKEEERLVEEFVVHEQLIHGK